MYVYVHVIVVSYNYTDYRDFELITNKYVKRRKKNECDIDGNRIIITYKEY